MRHSKQYLAVKSKIGNAKKYTLDEAIVFIKENKRAKFDESVEVHINLGVDFKKTEQQVKGSIIFPNNIGKKLKIAAFVSPEKIKEAQEAGAEIVGGEELISQIKEDKKADFDLAVAEPKIMPKLAQIAKILGPRGLMPSPKTETVGEDIKGIISVLQKGKIHFKGDATGNIHQIIGKTSWEAEKIKANYQDFLKAVRKAKPAGSKGTFLKSTTLCSTMGPALKIIEK